MKQIVFVGTASQKLGREITTSQSGEFGESKVVVFANSEIKITIKSKVEGREVVLVQSIANPTNNNLVELLFFIDALKRQGASHLTVIIPYFGYARQNMQHLPGECVSLNVVVKMLEVLEVDKVITVELHDEGSSSVFSIPFENKSALPYLAEQVYQELNLNTESEKNYLVVSPDQGGVGRARIFADSFYRNKEKIETVVVEKKRNLEGLHDSQAVEVFGDVRGKELILVDDVATSGKTLLNAADLCLKHGAKSVSAAVVHADFAQGVVQTIQSSQLLRLYTTNTIEKTLDNLANFDKIKVYDITPALTGVNRSV